MSRIFSGDYHNLKDMQLVDMHCHSRLSDSKHSAEDILKKAKKLGIGICITDHNNIDSSLSIQKKIFSIPSVELTSSESCDILAYFPSAKDASSFYNKNILNHRAKERFFIKLWRLDKTAAELIEKLQDYNALTAIAHPFSAPPKDSYRFFCKKNYLLKKVDAIEGYNGMMPQYRNRPALAWANSISKPVIAGSDSHNVNHIGLAMTACFASSPLEFLEQIRKDKNYIVVNKKLTVIERYSTNVAILARNLVWRKAT